MAVVCNRHMSVQRISEVFAIIDKNWTILTSPPTRNIQGFGLRITNLIDEHKYKSNNYIYEAFVIY